MIEELLERLHFSEYKKRAYLAIYKLQKSTAPKIAKVARIPSSKIYEILDRLVEEGYLNKQTSKPIQYSLNNPESVFKKKIQAQTDSIAKTQNIFENTEFVRSEQSETFSIVNGRDAFFERVKIAVRNSETSIIGIVKSWRIDFELKTLIHDFVKRGGEIRLIGPKKDDNADRLKVWHDIGVQTKSYAPDETRFTIWDNNVIAIAKKTEKEYESLWIENELLGKVLADYFEKIWNS